MHASMSKGVYVQHGNTACVLGSGYQALSGKMAVETVSIVIMLPSVWIFVSDETQASLVLFIRDRIGYS